jgi:predicted DNA-binding transcriptional regulator AlpA
MIEQDAGAVAHIDAPEVIERQLGRELRARLKILTEYETCALLEIGRSTLQAWRAAGTGPSFVRFGRSIFYTEKALNAWMEENAFSPKNRK